jgi:hypothetical protein
LSTFTNSCAEPIKQRPDRNIEPIQAAVRRGESGVETKEDH